MVIYPREQFMKCYSDARLQGIGGVFGRVCAPVVRGEGESLYVENEKHG